MRYSLMSLLLAFVILVAGMVIVQTYLSSVGQRVPGLGTKAAECKVMVPLTVMNVNAYLAPYNTVLPGDTVCIAAGDRSGVLTITNFRGAEGQPITFTNYGGKVRVDVRQDWTAVYLTNDEYIRLSGAGDPGVPFGFELYNSTGNGINAGKKTRYLEIERVEIHDAGNAGIDAKTRVWEIADTDGDGSVRDEWRQYNTYIHHSWLHDIGKEGFYIGSSFWEEGQDPELEGVEISYNKIERTGWDGLQVGSAVKNVKVHHNTVVDAGLTKDPNAGNNFFGIIVNKGTTGDFYNNQVFNSHSVGIYIQGIGNYRVYNNLVYNSGIVKTYDGIYWVIGNPGYFYNNTVVKASRSAIRCGSTISSGAIYDNLVAEAIAPQVGFCDKVSPVNNLAYTSAAQAGFVDLANKDFHLTVGSSAVNAGSSSGFAPFDLDDKPRPQGARSDIGAYEYGGSVTSPSPRPTPAPSTTSVRVKLEGINQQRADRLVSLVIKQGTTTVGSFPNVRFVSDTSGTYTGSVSIAPGVYDLYVTGPVHLTRRFPNQNMGPNITLNITNLPLFAGDIIRNNVVDTGDYNRIVEDFGPRMPASGSAADLDLDQDVDIFDYAYLVGNFGVGGE